MVMKPEPVFEAVETVLGADLGSVPIILLTPQGRVFDQGLAAGLTAYPRLALLCGRYEGVDERVRRHLASLEISIGDYVIPAVRFLRWRSSIPSPDCCQACWATPAPRRTTRAAGLLSIRYTRPAEFADGPCRSPHSTSRTHRRLAKEESLRRCSNAGRTSCARPN
jgi:tRNA (guanine37-N1)-methyltransferase